MHGEFKYSRKPRFIAASLGLLLLSIATGSQARIVTVRWTDPNPDPTTVAGFRLHVGSQPGVYQGIVDLGLPPADANDIRSRDASFPDGLTIYVAMTAYDANGGESAKSNEKVWVALPASNLAPQGTIALPVGPVTINAGESVKFAGTGTDADNDVPLSYQWNFDGAGVSNAAAPGAVTFPQAGLYDVRFTVTDAAGFADPSPAMVRVTVIDDGAPPPGPGSIGNGNFLPSANIPITKVASGLASPIYLTAPTGDPRLFVAEAGGAIRVIKNGSVLPTPFLDLMLDAPGTELLSIAFDPEYAKNGAFYVHYVDTDGKTVLSRFTVSADPDIAIASSEAVLLVVDQPGNSQNGGAIAFSPNDGFLYVGMGDGGGANDPLNVAQSGGSLLGKLLRLDVAVPPAATSVPAGAYAIPADNPFRGDPAVLDEIWALGVRNPYSFSFDREIGNLWLADEGNEQREELNFEAAASPGGNNYGWDVMEGTACGALPAPFPACGADSLTPPIHEYEHDEDHCSITGGFVYRGGDAAMAGDYFFGDYCSGSIWSIDPITGRGTNWSTAFGDAAGQRLMITSFGEGGGGDLFVLHENGDVFRVGAASPACSDRLDNDNDGLIDAGVDPGCRDSASTIEDPVCNDGIDNDGDNMIDVLDPECEAPWANAEDASSDDGGGGGGGKACGIGFELAILLPPVMWFRRRRRAGGRSIPQLSRFALDR